MTSVVTGGAGYIGGHLVDHLIENGEDVISIDDYSFGSYVNEKAQNIKLDLRIAYPEIPKEAIIYHLAANPDVKTSMENIYDHFERDVKVTLNAMEMARKYDAKMVIFFSSSTVYGEGKIPTTELDEIKPISNYGLFKVLGEEILNFYARNYGIRGVSLRLANITGGRVSHGVVIDFIKKLRKNKEVLEILGNGKQRKSYLYITDLLSAVDVIVKYFKGLYDSFNIGNDDWVTVDEIARIVEEEMGLSPKHVYIDAGEGRGWKGDVRFVLLDISKIKSFGWLPKYSSAQAIRLAVRDILDKV
ncbi:NAD-dependent epimerase/dehydratase family protein [Acidianus ambivalens]|uniref:NAD-dependent epimerase/dehydratase family protein n=1 Tax=Acidianus ambivalens TaxID=2283 RepID=A0A650CUG6_ACIAM|nr:NAD-dependent epimerase/dehydratase family protein [Acidianus ambivalens]MQL55964.1 NAD-dependent epimerase/dehydratase family protein [Acidianus ambivalens]QGR21479.1 NAD-dependent epimerase/dehydratase family protein [Acidianus ambivalens]